MFVEAGFVRWTPADLPWRRLDDDGVEVPRPERDERVSDYMPFFSTHYLTKYEGWNVGDARRAFGRGGTEHDQDIPPLTVMQVPEYYVTTPHYVVLYWWVRIGTCINLNDGVASYGLQSSGI